MDLDLLFRGATLVDGTGAEPRRADLGVRGRRIAALGEVPASARAAREVDARGLVLAPGFVDLHTHSDTTLLADPRGESKALQGVTTECVGNCGFSAFPVEPERLALHVEHLEGITQAPPVPAWTDFDGYARAVEERGTALNLAPLVGHGCLRIAAAGLEREPTAEQAERMAALLDAALEQGAFGLSTGLTYVPSMYAPTEEIVELARVVARHGGLYATHARVTGEEGESIEEAVAIGRGSGARVQYSHVAINHPERWGRAQHVLDVFRRARAGGVDVAFDVYPYDASSSALTQYLPEWVQAGGIEALRERLRDPATRRRAVEETARGWYGGIPWLWERVVVCQCGDASVVGRTLAELSEEPADLVLRLCEEHGNEVKVVLFYRTEEDMLAFLADPLASVGSDGNAIALHQDGDRPHPRHFGTFPRVLGRYVRERGALGLAEAVRKMTAAPAERLGLRDRGRLAEGLAADLVAFDAAEVADAATFVDPCRPPRGILHVVVNGELVVDGGVQTDARPGRVLRRA